MKKNNIFIPFIVFLFFCQASIFSEKIKTPDEKKQAIKKNEVKNNPWEIKYEYKRNINDQMFWELAIFDFLIPGYGMYALGQYYWASSYALGRVIGTLLIYFSVNSYLFWKPFTDEVSRLGNLDAQTQFDIPGVGKKTARQILNKSDASLVLVMFSVTFEVILSGVSILHALSDYRRQNKKGTYYKIDFGVSKETKLKRADLKFGYQFIF